MRFIKALYPRACDGRLPKNDPSLREAKKSFFKAAGINFVLLQILFLGLFCYIFGSLFQQSTHIHNLRIVFVDYDGGGAIGGAVRNAYASLQGSGFPSLIEREPAEFAGTDELVDAVCHTSYWAAIYVTKGASGRLAGALAEESEAEGYDNSDVIGYIWNEALYPPTGDVAISGNIQALSRAARVAYSTGNGTGRVRSVAGSASLSVLAEPWQLKSTNIQPTSQGSRAVYNTLVIVLVLIQEFFYLGTINGLFAQYKLFHRTDAYRSIVVRNLTSLAYTFIGSLCVIGTIWAFKAGWTIRGSQFVLSWMTLWLFAHTNFLVLDVLTIWLPHPFVLMALISWIIVNITSVLLPLELSPAFYRIGYIFPAHEVIQVLTDIWSHGCNPKLRYALPVLFSWEVLALALSALGVFRRSHFAMIGEEAQERAFRERVDAAMAREAAREGELGRGTSQEADMKGDSSTAERDTEVVDSRDQETPYRDELADVIRKITSVRPTLSHY